MSSSAKASTVKETIVRRGGDSSDRIRAGRQLAVIGGMEDQLKKCQHASREAERVLRQEQSKSLKMQEAVDAARDALGAAQEAIDSDPLPEKAQPASRIQQRDMMQLKVAQLEAALDAQKRVATSAFESLKRSEIELYQIEKRMHQSVQGVRDAEAKLISQATLDVERSQKLGDLEVTRAKRWGQEQKSALKAREQQILDVRQVAERQVAAASQAHVAASQRATLSNKLALDTIAEAEQVQKDKWEHRVQTILEFRDNQNAVRAKAATDSERKANKIRQRQEQLENEKASLLAKGLNPYAEFRRQDIEAEDAAAEHRLKTAVERNKVDLAVQLIREEREDVEKDQMQTINKMYEKKQRDELSRGIIEEKRRSYIQSVTKDGREQLDPSGRAALIYPSQITSIPDFSFGLGKSSKISPDNMRVITDKIRQKLAVDKDDVGEYKRLIEPLKKYAAHGEKVGTNERSQSAPRPGRTTKAASDVDPEVQTQMTMFNTLSGPRGYMPGNNSTIAEVNAQPEGELKTLLRIVEDENGSLDNSAELGADDNTSPKYKVTKRSKFEMDSLDRAKTKAKTLHDTGVTQVAAGKTFKGASFVSNPAVIEFKDFEPGKVYKKKFILTNVSYTFNSFQLLPLDDSFIDFFEIAYEKPGRMSAGVSCSLEITFSPKLNDDILGDIKLLTQTGPVNIPLQCLKKRCIPRVLVEEVDFGEVIIGQINRQKITIKNTGALPTKFVAASAWMAAVSIDNADASDTQNDGVQLDLPSEGQSGSARVSPRDASNKTTGDNPNILTLDTLGSSEEEIQRTHYGSGDPALNDGELDSRIKLTLTDILRRKKRERPNALVVEPSPGSSAVASLRDNIECVEGTIDGYSSITLDIVCAPLTVGPQSREVLITFEDVIDADKSVDEKGRLVTRDQRVVLKVVGNDLPVFVEKVHEDFHYTTFGRMFRSRFELTNRGKASYRADIGIPSPMNKYIEVNPNTMFVQAGGKQTVNIKFTPTLDMLRDLAYFTVPDASFVNTCRLGIPIEVKVVNQDLPIHCVLDSVVTQSNVELSTSFLDFEDVYVNQTACKEVTLTNTSALPQKVAFVRLKKEVKVAPNDGFAVLLPNESVVFDVTFTAFAAVKYEFGITVMTSMNDTYVINAQANGVEAPIELSNAVMLLRTTCDGHRVLESTVVKNTTSKKQIVEISAPDPRFSWIKVSPTICELAPGSSQRLEFEFNPPVGLLGLDPLEWHKGLMFPAKPKVAVIEAPPVAAEPAKGGKAAPAAAKGKGGKDVKATEPEPVAAPAPVDTKPELDLTPKPTPFTQWREENGWTYANGLYGSIQWALPENVFKVRYPEPERPEVEDSSAAENQDAKQEPPPSGYIGNWSLPIFIKPKGFESVAASGISTKPLYVNLQSVVVPPQYILDVTSIDFGQISIGTRLVRTVKLRNLTDEIAKLTATGLNAVGPFTILNAIREVPRGEWIQVVIECLPKIPGLVTEAIEFKQPDGGHVIRLPLRVQGVNPTVELSGLEENAVVGKLLDFGNVVIADTAAKKFTITNTSAFPVPISIQRSTGKGLPPRRELEATERNLAGLPLFMFRPEAAVISPGSKVDIEVIYQPDKYRSLPNREDIDINIGDGDNDLAIKVHVCGRSQGRQAFVLPSLPRDEPFVVQDFGMVPAEDALQAQAKAGLREQSKQLAEDLGVGVLPDRPIILEFPDLYRDDLTAAEQASIEAMQKEAAALLGPAAANTGANIIQVKKIVVCGARINDSRGTAPAAMSFEVQLTQEAKDSGLFSLSASAKGNVAVGADTTVAIGCILPRPKGLGGLQVGSWQTYRAEAVLRGGWKPDKEPEACTVPILLRAFVRL